MIAWSNTFIKKLLFSNKATDFITECKLKFLTDIYAFRFIFWYFLHNQSEVCGHYILILDLNKPKNDSNMYDFLQTHLLAPTNHFEALRTSTRPHRAHDPRKLFRIPSALKGLGFIESPCRAKQSTSTSARNYISGYKIDWNTRIHIRDRQSINQRIRLRIKTLTIWIGRFDDCSKFVFEVRTFKQTIVKR